MPATRHHLYRLLHSALKEKRRVLLVTHEHADGDAFGSTLALRLMLGQSTVALAPESSPVNFAYLAGIATIEFEPSKVNVREFDAVVMLDCGDVKRTRIAEQLADLGDRRPFVAVIDHHPTTTIFRGHDLVDLKIIERGVTSTCELVAEYARVTRAAVTPELATCLLTGIITDTGGFTNLATTVEGMDVAADLMRKGANLRRIVSATMRSKSVGILHLWGRALSRLEYDPSTELVTTALTLEDFRECGVEREASEGLSNFLNSLGEGKVVLVLREEPNGLVKGSYRTKHPDVDVAAMAAVYGGGGHKKAAGFSLAGKIVRSDRGWKVDPVQA